MPPSTFRIASCRGLAGLVVWLPPINNPGHDRHMSEHDDSAGTGHQPLAGRRIILGVSGGIAAYKSPMLVRRLRDAGADVQVVTTRGAEHFVTTTALQAVSGRPVRNDLFDEQAEAAMGHIELARWAELLVIAPATADLLARFAQSGF